MHVFSLNGNETDYLYGEIFDDESYIPPQGWRIPEKPVILDVGANIGLFTLFATQRWPGARVFSFEPAPDVFDALRRNAGHLPGVHVHNLALGDEDQSRELTYYPHYTMMSGFDADPAVDKVLASAFITSAADALDEEFRDEFIQEAEDLVDDSLGERRLVRCDVQRVETFAGQAGIDRVDLLKVDVEGFELRVLQGVGDRLWPGIANAAVEVADRGGALDAVVSLLESQGMTTSVRQAAEYRTTDLHTVFAWRVV
ncbi:FkbM family methyltransferase [Streptomyces sp. SID10815]|uniref:FkbM family methyltransferase n=1 Tax=Streptomyces sp. SID10815 TaxID=2706027 RepID=UPI0013C7D2E9|nr:FkbM family methyltransferase [Streptomyces sp. SID10815]NEA46938.1 FkbM family methyltransferase [Streptomyces sp. SID10815]